MGSFVVPALATIQQLYTVIADELRATEALFEQELQCDLPFSADLCSHTRRYRGKMLRPALHLLAARASGQVSRENITLAAVLEMVHVATLVHDDVLDEAQIRRRDRTLNSLAGNHTAVLVGDYLISHAYHLCSSLELPYAARTIASCTNTVCEGELLQVFHRHRWDLTQEQYFTMITRKTAVLVGVACMLGAKYAGADARSIQAMEAFGLDVGVAFQIVDDCLDLSGNERQMGKTLGRDLADGKPTLPVIHFLSTATQSQRQAFMRLRQDHPEALTELLEASIDYARQIAQQRIDAALDNLEVLEPSPALESLRGMAEFVVQRQI